MGKKLNCWEFKNCNHKFHRDSDVCPVMLSTENDGKNGGKNGGRICWQIAGSFSREKVQCKHMKKQGSCLKCDFAQYVFDQEGKHLKFL